MINIIIYSIINKGNKIKGANITMFTVVKNKASERRTQLIGASSGLSNVRSVTKDSETTVAEILKAQSSWFSTSYWPRASTSNSKYV